MNQIRSKGMQSYQTWIDYVFTLSKEIHSQQRISTCPTSSSNQIVSQEFFMTGYSLRYRDVVRTETMYEIIEEPEKGATTLANKCLAVGKSTDIDTDKWKHVIECYCPNGKAKHRTLFLDDLFKFYFPCRCYCNYMH